jgi:arginyl-tRNA synthetase
MKEVVQELIELWIATKNEDGSVGVIFPEETKIPSCMLAKKDGTHGYLASDLACVKYRLTNGWNPDYIYYCTDVRQELHFRQVLAITKKWLEIGGWGKEVKKIPEFIHVKNGYIRLKEGAMSSRKGNIVRLEDLLDEAFIRTQKILEEKNSILSESDTRAIAVGAVKYSYLMQDRERDIIFDWDKALNFEWHSWPYIQYSYVRAKNILDKAKQELQHTPSFEMLQKIPQENSLLSEYDRELLQTLLRMKEVIELTLKQAKPHHLANYSYELATNFSSFYVHTPKLLEEKNQTLLQIRLALVMLTWQTLGHVFALLAIRMPSKM